VDAEEKSELVPVALEVELVGEKIDELSLED
jgi:hypothetical protein